VLHVAKAAPLAIEGKAEIEFPNVLVLT
jgi:hypothetical protein